MKEYFNIKVLCNKYFLFIMNHRAMLISLGLVAGSMGNNSFLRLQLQSTGYCFYASSSWASAASTHGRLEPEMRDTGCWLYPMGPGIDFPLIMNYTDTNTGYGEPYFYFLNGHGDVTYFADASFTPEQIESYEYTPWGVLLTSASKNNLLYTAREFDFETGLQFNRMRYYSPNLGRFCEKHFLFQDNNYFE